MATVFYDIQQWFKDQILGHKKDARSVNNNKTGAFKYQHMIPLEITVKNLQPPFN